MLANSILLEPVSTFFYTWRFLDSLDYEHSGSHKNLFRRVRITLVFLVPLVYCALYLGVVILLAKQDFYVEAFDFKQAEFYKDRYRVSLKVLGYWTTFFNLFSCAVLGLVILYVRKLTNQSIQFLSASESVSTAN